MIEKSIAAPACSYSTFDFPLPKLRAGGNLRKVRLRHLKEEGNALVCAEGASLAYTPTVAVHGLFATDSEVYASNDAEMRLYKLASGGKFDGVNVAKRVVECVAESGEKQVYVLAKNRVYRLSGENALIAKMTGGSCAALHHERLFVGGDMRLSYSEPLYYAKWSDVSTQAAGFLDFTDALGNILEVVSFKDRLYVFRENGITQLRADGDTLDFRVEDVPYGCGKIVADSVANCGDAVYFFTEFGLYAFDGTTCKRASDADDGDLDFTAPTEALAYHGSYYASVCGKDGVRVLYSYDTRALRGRTVFFPCEAIACGKEIFFQNGDRVYRLEGRSLPESGSCALELEFAPSGGEVFFESVTVDGEGEFALSVRSESGECANATGKGGKRAVLSRAVRGRLFSVSIAPCSAECTVFGVTIGTRRDEK